MTHLISSKPGLKEFQEQGNKLTAKAKKDMKRLLRRRSRFHKWVAEINSEKTEL